MNKLTPDQLDFIIEHSEEYTIKEMCALFDVRRTLVWSCLKTFKLKPKKADRTVPDVDREVVIDWDACAITGYKTF